MYIYAGIDEAGYGPMFGPLLVGRAVLAVPRLEPDADPPQLWQRLSKAVCRDLTRRNGRIAVNDSKKLYSPASGLAHLERGVLAFAGVAGHQPADLCELIDCLSERSHHQLDGLPWYQPTDVQPWQTLPVCCTRGEIAVARSMLAATCQRIGVEVPDLGATIVFENRFNEMLGATRSKAATSFTFVAAHLQHIWRHFGQHSPRVVVDRQSGRSHYRELLAITFPEAHLTILDESPGVSTYRLIAPAGPPPPGAGSDTAGIPGSPGSPGFDCDHPRAMTVSFEVEAEARHMPVALASMISKYVRELFMARFQVWFAHRAPQIKPTAGYATDAKRFWQEIEPLLPDLAIPAHSLRRMG